MLDTVFRGLFDTALTDTISPGNFLICVAVSLILGLLLCAMTGWQSRSSRSVAVIRSHAYETAMNSQGEITVISHSGDSCENSDRFRTSGLSFHSFYASGSGAARTVYSSA